MLEGIRSYHVVQVPHQSMQIRLSYRHDGQTDRQIDSFSALYSRKKIECLHEKEAIKLKVTIVSNTYRNFRGISWRTSLKGFSWFNFC